MEAPLAGGMRSSRDVMRGKTNFARSTATPRNRKASTYMRSGAQGMIGGNQMHSGEAEEEEGEHLHADGLQSVAIRCNPNPCTVRSAISPASALPPARLLSSTSSTWGDMGRCGRWGERGEDVEK